MRYVFTLLLLANAGQASETSQLCIENGLETHALFTVEIDQGGRASADLAPDGRLCVSGDGKGTIAVFADPEELEGCSRRVSADSVTRLTAFPNVDLCSWQKL